MVLSRAERTSEFTQAPGNFQADPSRRLAGIYPGIFRSSGPEDLKLKLILFFIYIFLGPFFTKFHLNRYKYL